MSAKDGATLIEGLSDNLALDVLQRANPAVVSDLISALDEVRRAQLFANAPETLRRQWTLNQTFSEDSIGRLMEPPTAMFRPTESVGEVTEKVRELVKKI